MKLKQIKKVKTGIKMNKNENKTTKKPRKRAFLIYRVIAELSDRSSYVIYVIAVIVQGKKI